MGQSCYCNRSSHETGIMLCLFSILLVQPWTCKLRMVRALPVSIAPITLPSGEIAPSHLRVPLPDGTSAPIPALLNKDASLMLSIYFSPTSGGGTHICKMAKMASYGQTGSNHVHSHPTLHSRVLSTNYNQEWWGALLPSSCPPTGSWNSFNGCILDVSP